ncbi:MAG: hypothetical protein CMJ58_00175 [Planctomycetaceae bacterium]|nr:hypothetical protein [Planctomycetaceae bacterium]
MIRYHIAVSSPARDIDCHAVVTAGSDHEAITLAVAALGVPTEILDEDLLIDVCLQTEPGDSQYLDSYSGLSFRDAFRGFLDVVSH